MFYIRSLEEFCKSNAIDDIPDDVVAFGNPCRIFRKIDERDREYYSRWNDPIDWENLQGICDAKKDLPKFN